MIGASTCDKSTYPHATVVATPYEPRPKNYVQTEEYVMVECAPCELHGLVQFPRDLK